jgi:RNA polymerase sigma factor (sigma-70 family)
VGQAGDLSVIGHAEGSTADPDTARRRARAQRLGALLVRAQAGDRECLREIVAELTPLLWNVARGQGLARADAEDVVQSVWLSLVSCLPTIRTPDALVGWLVTAAKREAWRARKARERTSTMDADEISEAVDPGEPVEERILAEERRRLVRDALDGLTPSCAALLRALAFSDHADYATVARLLGMRPGSIGPNRGRCLAKLRTQIVNDPRWSALCP